MSDRNAWDVYYANVNDLYHDGFEDGIKFWLRHLYTGYIDSIEMREHAETLAVFRRWKSVDEWLKLLEGEV